MAFNAITPADLAGKGNVGLPDTPGLSTEAMQRKLDELALDVIVPKFNGLVDALAAQTGAADIGAEGGSVQAALDALAQGKATVNALDALEARVEANERGKVDTGAFDTLADRVTAAENDKAEATDLDALAARVTAAESGKVDNGEFDALETRVAAAEAGKADKSEVLRKGSGEAYTPAGPYDPATRKYVDDTVTAIGAGDMSRAVYDTDGDGVVDDAAALGGVAASEYVTAGTLAAAEERIASAAAAAQTTADTAVTDAAAAQTTADTNKTDLSSHTGNSSNPHGVTKAQVGLGNVSNVAQMPLTGGAMMGNLSVNPSSGEAAISAISSAGPIARLSAGADGVGVGCFANNSTWLGYGFSMDTSGNVTYNTNSNMMPKSGGTFTGQISVPATSGDTVVMNSRIVNQAYNATLSGYAYIDFQLK